MGMKKYKSHETYLQATRKYRKDTGSFKYEPRDWTDAEDERVLNASIPDRQLGIEIERSMKAIQCRRRRLREMYNI